MKLSAAVLISFATGILAAPIAMAGDDGTPTSYNSPGEAKSYDRPKTETHSRPDYTKPRAKLYQPEFAQLQWPKTRRYKLKQPKPQHTNPQSRPKPKPEPEPKSHHKKHKLIPHQPEYAGPQKRNAHNTNHKPHNRKHRHANSQYSERYY
ncbi:hypothetical protein FOPG_19708 [Fusarium oxysporum f. sp. conglutinans race 2 54008]|uniref:Uncharacterized protein n=3 Tax=Fusarium oxysporum f. sp. conglutinans TaxID=100902 RepID=A0A8H6H0T0_FUSOX|nr:hypothetical protein FOXB_17331 [Fusarium oxysporum f. sp. conglutinans Fo5176]EXL64023.1 hypothetical protein FOPG_19708 [Fusarium oxysporum f. sp. conglutinans race 2 54008]KAF6528023.1 hypothetical protein HZS61_008325 [Fusarium oxysporum f. sp. conglutinans]KAG7001004.1 hypothetical protein FocnCong_v012901 [Fusarium oxysporum f. sp. conglutinans]KAI8416848.1 hypothetical protein FOFC_03161 [Fusarium oxysporum]